MLTIISNICEKYERLIYKKEYNNVDNNFQQLYTRYLKVGIVPIIH